MNALIKLVVLDLVSGNLRVVSPTPWANYGRALALVVYNLLAYSEISALRRELIYVRATVKRNRHGGPCFQLARLLLLFQLVYTWGLLNFIIFPSRLRRIRNLISLPSDDFLLVSTGVIRIRQGSIY